MSCCNPDSPRKCNFESVKNDGSKEEWMKSLYKTGCAKPLLNFLRGDSKFSMVLSNSLALPVILINSVIMRYFWTNLQSIDDEEDLDEKALIPAFLLTYDGNL